MWRKWSALNGVEIGSLKRTFNVARAVPEIARDLPPETGRWLGASVRGPNHYIVRAETLPHEFRLFGLQREAWSVVEVLTLGWLVSGDVNWIVWLHLCPAHELDADQ